jgi:hypothetical protein
MATVRQIITAALRKAGVVSEGQPAPNAYDTQNALYLFQGWYDASMASGLFGRLEDVIIEDDYEAGEFERITNTSDADVTVTLPATITDDPNSAERVPLDLCPVVVVDPGADPLNYIYDGIVGDWVSLNDLTLDSVAPLSQRGQGGLSSVLAVLMSEELGYTVGPATLGSAQKFLTTIAERRSSPRKVTEGSFY